ncbi:MAG TPA: hypothetical protein VEK08_20435 [Planctomycetota bacterium]|nr:hypothetical protein [Planctomycetota bacterium]
MPCKTVYEKEGTGVWIVCTGDVTAADVLQVKEALYKPEQLGKLCYQIWDFTSADKINLTSDDLQACAVLDGHAFKSNCRQVRALVGSKEVFHGLDRLFTIYTEVWSANRIRTFETISDARAWIDSVTAP